MKHLAVMVLVGLLFLLGHQQGWQRTGLAQTTDSERAFVYGINAAVPETFVGTFAPPATDAIYLLADGTSVISPRFTEIYFWPITNEYRAEWSALNEPVPGVLELLKDGQILAELSPTDYTIHFKQAGESTTTGELFLGQAAVDAEASFRARQEAFQKASSEYFDAEQAWLDAMAEVSARQAAGESVTVPPEPVRPEPIGIFSNGLNSGIPINLDPGQYGIRLRGADGEIVPDSERKLVVFAPRRTGVGYTIVPETRWTTPLESSAPSDIIFGAANSALYLEPHLAREYPARDWALLQNPQGLSQSGGWDWVNGEQLGDQELEISAGGEVQDRQSLTSFNVRQMPGSQLGYEVIPMDPAAAATPEPTDSGRPDFEAYPIALEAPGEHVQIRLMSEDGEVAPGSIRQVRVPGNPPINRLFVLPVIPLLAGALVISRRRHGTRASRNLTG